MRVACAGMCARTSAPKTSADLPRLTQPSVVRGARRVVPPAWWRYDQAQLPIFQDKKMLLFFKQIYRAPILSGEKTDTIRNSARGAKPGRLMKACVGPSRIFATVEILSVDLVGSLNPARLAQVIGCYGKLPKDAVRLTFRVVNPTQPAA